MTDVGKIETRTVNMDDGVVQTTRTETTENEHETITNIHTETAYPVRKEPLAGALSGDSKPSAANSLSTAPKTAEQEANLAKLQDARNFMLETEEGKELAQALINQDCDISKSQKKWLKKQGIDPDAFIQEWNKAHPELRKNKVFDAKAATENLDDMGALANAHLGEDTEEHPQNRATAKDVAVRNPDKRTFLQKIFTRKEKQKVKDSKEFAQTGGSKVNIHSSKNAQRDADFLQDISDDIAREGQEFLDAYKNQNGKRRIKFKEIDEKTGDVITTKVKYNKDGSVRKIVRKSDTQGKLRVKAAKDGHIAIKGDLQSNNIMKEAKVEVSDKTIIQEKCDEEDNKLYLGKKLEEVVVKPEKPVKPVKPVKPTPPPTPPTPPTPPPAPPVTPILPNSLKGAIVSDTPGQTFNFNNGKYVPAGSEIRNMNLQDPKLKQPPYKAGDGDKFDNGPGVQAMNGLSINELAHRKDFGVKGLVQGFCGNPADHRYKASTANGNLNQQNAKNITGCFIHAKSNGTKPGPGGRKVANLGADYTALSSFINAAAQRDNKAKDNDKILGYIAREIKEHNNSVAKRKYNVPNSNNDLIDIRKLPKWFVTMYRL